MGLSVSVGGKNRSKEKRVAEVQVQDDGGLTAVAAVRIRRSELFWRPPLIGCMGCDNEEKTVHFL